MNANKGAGMTKSIEDRLISLSQRDENGCLLWVGALTPTGYGKFKVGGRKGRQVGVHRAAYQEWVGEVPDGLEIDHLCRVRNCIEPTHLEAVTHAENLRRIHSDRTHCFHGHELTAENVYLDRKPSGIPSRKCRACRKQLDAKRRTTSTTAYLDARRGNERTTEDA